MTESTTRNFLSQWSYDQAQGRHDPRVETTVQLLSVDRVAGQMRQRKEHYVEEDFDAMDFETRSAVLEAHYFQATDRARHSAGGLSPSLTTKVARARPQSASAVRRIETNATTKSSCGMLRRPRPHSAKNRSETPSANAIQTENQVEWKSSKQQNSSKWREMLARGPEFKQLALRRLEIETYELLYNTLEQRQATDTNPKTRRRKRRKNEIGLNRPQDQSPVRACGSGVHLARSRKKRQQEHDRQMMLGKGQRSSTGSASDHDKMKSAKGDEHAIQGKTRRRNKLLNKKKSEKQLEVKQILKPETQRNGPSMHRPQSVSTTARVPWVPSGSASSLAIRGIIPESGEVYLTQEKQIAQVLEAFQTHTAEHLYSTKIARDQLKKAQQSAKTANEKKSRRKKEAFKSPPDSVNQLKPPSRPIELIAPVLRGNQENDIAMELHLREPTLTEPVVVGLELAVATESLLKASPRMVVPPLKLPLTIREHQLTNESLGDISETTSHDHPSVALSFSGTEIQSQVESETATQSPLKDIFSGDFLLTVENGTGAAGIEESGRLSSEYSNDLDSRENDHSEGNLTSGRNEPVDIEEGYLTENLFEQLDSVLSFQDTEALSDECLKELQVKQEFPPILLQDCRHVTNALVGSGIGDDIELETRIVMYTPVDLCTRGLNVSMEEGAITTPLSSEMLLASEIPVSPTKEIYGVQISPEAPQFGVENGLAIAGQEMTSELNVLEFRKIEQHVGSAIAEVEQSGTEVYQELSCRPSDKSNADILDVHTAVDVSDILEDIHSVADLGLESTNCLRKEEGHEEGNETEVLIRSVPNGHEGTDDLPLDSNPSTGVTSSSGRSESGENILVLACSLQHKSESDLKNARAVCRGALSDASEVAPNCGNTDTYGAVSSSFELEDMKHAGNRETWSDPTTAIIQPPVTPFNRETNLPPTSAGCIAELSDTSAENTAVGLDETVTKALFINEEQTQMKLTSHAAVPANPVNDRVELLHSASTPSANSEAASYNQIRPDSTESTHVTTKTVSPDTKREYHSAKRKVNKPESNLGAKSSTPKKLQDAEVESEGPLCQIIAAEVAKIETTPAKVSAGDGKVGQAEESPLQHQRELTRLYLKRLSSRKLLEADSVSTRPPSYREQVELEGHLLSAESATAKAAAVVDAEAPVEDNSKSLKKQGNNDKDSALFLKCESTQVLNDCKLPVTVDPVMTNDSIENDDMAATSDSLCNELPFVLVVADADKSLEDADPVQSSEEEGSGNAKYSTSGDHAALTSEQPVTTTDNVNLTVPPSAEHHRASSKIQAQYRCFLRRRVILDQLRFMLAKKRRHSRKSLKKRTKVKTVDMFGNETVETAVRMQASGVDNALEKVQEGTLDSVSGELGVEMLLRPLSIKEVEPLKADVKLCGRQDSCAYAFDLFDESNDMSGEMMPTLDVESDDGCTLVGAVHTNDTCFVQSRNEQEGRAVLPAEDVDPSGTNTKSIRTSLQAEEIVLQQQPSLSMSSRTELESNPEPELAGGLPTSMMLAEFASHDTGEPSDAITKVQPQWERYVDNTTSKSFYNSVTNETQLTTPEDFTDKSFRTTPTTPHVAPAAITDALESARAWEEFLDETSGQMFYYNTQTGASSWTLPTLNDGSTSTEIVASDATAERVASAWVMYIDPASQAPYYVNVETLATSWEKPNEFEDIPT